MQQLWQRSEKNVRETVLQTPRSVRKEGGRIWGSCPASGEWWSMLFPCSSWKNTVEISMLLSVKEHAIHGASMLEQVPRGNCGLCRTHAGPANSLRSCTPWIGHILEQFFKNCSPWEGLMLEMFVEGWISWEENHARAWENCDEEWKREVKGYKLTATPIPHPPVLLGVGRSKKTMNEVKPRKNKEEGGVYF